MGQRPAPRAAGFNADLEKHQWFLTGAMLARHTLRVHILEADDHAAVPDVLAVPQPGLSHSSTSAGRS
jgi:hypothetical protein